MLKFNLENGTQLQIDREPLEMKVLESIFTRLDAAKTQDKMMYSVLKTAVQSMMMFGKLDFELPKENALEHLIGHYVGIGFNALEKDSIEVKGEIVSIEKEEKQPSSSSSEALRDVKES